MLGLGLGLGFHLVRLLQYIWSILQFLQSRILSMMLFGLLQAYFFKYFEILFVRT